jgi:hypothetical protein
MRGCQGGRRRLRYGRRCSRLQSKLSRTSGLANMIARFCARRRVGPRLETLADSALREHYRVSRSCRDRSLPSVLSSCRSGCNSRGKTVSLTRTDLPRSGITISYSNSSGCGGVVRSSRRATSCSSFSSSRLAVSLSRSLVSSSALSAIPASPPRRVICTRTMSIWLRHLGGNLHRTFTVVQALRTASTSFAPAP